MLAKSNQSTSKGESFHFTNFLNSSTLAADPRQPKPDTSTDKIREVAVYRSKRGESIAERLSTISDNSVTAKAVGYRLAQCAATENQWLGNDLHTSDGELFTATGNLFACGSRLCPTCTANLSRQNRRRAREIIQRLGNGDYNVRWRSLVLTMPLMKGVSVVSAIEKINEAFARMTNRKFWKSRVKGGIKSVEFTVRPDGYHVHIHLLILSEHIPVNAEIQRRFSRLTTKRRLFSGNLQSELAHCLKASGIALDGLPVCAVYDVRNRNIKARGNVEVSLEKALQETAKYLTASDSWDKIPDSSLIEIAEIKRWNRMFEVLGNGRNGKNSDSTRENPDSTRENPDSIGEKSETETEQTSLVHKQTLSNGERLISWRQLLNIHDFETWKRQIQARINRVRAFRKSNLGSRFGFAHFQLLSGESFGLSGV